MSEKSFLEKFRRYDPPAILRDVIDRITEYRVKLDVDARMIECDITLPTLEKRETLRAIEQGILEAYDLQDVHLVPHYPAELFSYEYIPELVAEMERVGIVSKGFFYD